MSQRTPAHFLMLIQKRSLIYFMNVRSQISSNEHEELSQRDVFIGKLGKSDLLNYFVILAKLHVWSSPHCTKNPNFDVFKEIVDTKYPTEKYIACKK